MTVEKFLERIKECKESGNEFGAMDVVRDFACEMSEAVSNVINGCVCEATSLVVASVLEKYASAIRKAHEDDMIAKMTEVIFNMSTKHELVSIKVPLNKEKGED